jgi:hypothetical protein
MYGGEEKFAQNIYPKISWKEIVCEIRILL